MLSFLGAYEYATIDAGIDMIVAYSVYILLRGGVFAVPQVGLMAVGGYTSALVSIHLTQSFVIGIVAGGVVAALAGTGLGILLRRLSGIYLAISSIAFTAIVQLLATNLSFTGGANGLIGIVPGLLDWQLVLILVIVVGVFLRLPSTRFGAAVDAMREDALVAAHQGVNVARTRVTLFALSGFTAGIGGALRAHHVGFIDPSAFTFSAVTTLLAIAVIGGMLSGIGPVLGGIIMDGIPQLASYVGKYQAIFSGAVIVVVVAFAPNGLAGVISQLIPGGWKDGVLSFASQLRPGAERAPDREAPRLIPVSPAGGRDAAPSVKPGAVLLRVVGAVKRFGGVTAVRDVSVDIVSGEVFGIIGPNGSGKTTFLNLLSGATKPDRIELALADRDVSGLAGAPAKLFRSGISRTFQGIRLLPHLNAYDNIRAGGLWQNRPGFLYEFLGLGKSRTADEELNARTAAALDRLGLGGVSQESISGLSYGTQRRVEIARSLVSSAKVLLLDEPTAGMTPGETDQIFELIAELADEGITVVVIEHDIPAISRHCDRVMVLDAGAVIAMGAPEDVMSNGRVVEAYVGAAS